MSQISITIPMEKNALLRASAMLAGLAADNFAETHNGVATNSKTTIVGGDSHTDSTTMMPNGDVFHSSTNIVELAHDAPKPTAPSVTETPSPVVVGASIAPEPESNDNPFQFAPLAPEPENTTLTSTISATASNADLDSLGLPWDARIHSSSKAKLAKGGGWKLKRGLDPQYVTDVENELRSVMAIPAPTETQGLHPNPDVHAITAAMPKPPAEQATITTFAQLMPAITSAKLDAAYVTSVLQQFGVPSMPLLAARQDLIPQVAAALGL